MISAGRSRSSRFFPAVRELYRLNAEYGENDADTVKGNCTGRAFPTGREWPLPEEISRLCGEDEAEGKRLITTSQLQRLSKEKGEVLILLGRQYPYIAHLADIDDYHFPAGGSVRIRTSSRGISLSRPWRRTLGKREKSRTCSGRTRHLPSGRAAGRPGGIRRNGKGISRRQSGAPGKHGGAG